MRRCTRAAALLTAVCLGVSALPPVSVSAADFSANYAEALQKSMYFYECQQAGPLPEWNEVEWRADSTMSDEITGGWYDAGDHVKFNLPMAYSASMLAWGLYQYPDGLEQTGEMETYVDNLSFVLDYLAACDEGDTAVYQVGNGQMDHTWWGPVELLEYGMKDNGADYTKARAVLRGTDSAVCGEMAAAPIIIVMPADSTVRPTSMTNCSTRQTGCTSPPASSPIWTRRLPTSPIWERNWALTN